MTNPITWTDGYDATLTLARVESILGAAVVEAYRREKHGPTLAECSARGWREANEPELFAAYRSLASILRDEPHPERDARMRAFLAAPSHKAPVTVRQDAVARRFVMVAGQGFRLTDEGRRFLRG